MDSCQFTATYIAVVRFSPNKGCFMFVPDVWIKGLSGEIFVSKILYGENKEAFVSCLKGKTSYESGEYEVQLNAKYAEKLGIKEKEKICFQPLITRIPRAQKIILEPLTSDDWEMLELNSKLIEVDLMNQIRVVWVNQIFPVWANQSSFYVKVAEAQPNHIPVVLAEFTELHIVPKERFHSSQHYKSNTNSKKLKKKANYLQFEHLRNKSKRELSTQDVLTENQDSNDGYFFDSENKSAAARALSFISSWFSTSNEDKFISDEYQDDSNDFVPLNFDSVLRVIPHSNPKQHSLPLIVQATTVFISAGTYILLCGDNEVPPCFVATLEKFLLPDDGKRKASNANKQKVGREDGSLSDTLSRSKRKNQSKNDSTEDFTKLKPFNSIAVTVMVVQSSEEDEFNLPSSLFYSKNFIVVPRELKRCLNLEVSSLVHVRSVHTKPIRFNTLLLHPASTVSSVAEETLLDNFKKWAFAGDREYSTFLLSNGTLLNLNLHGQKCDFFITLHNYSDPASANTSISSTNSNSPSASDTERNGNSSKGHEYGYLYSQLMKRIIIKIGCGMCSSIHVDRPYLLKPADLYPEIHALRLEALGGVNQLAAKAMEDIEFWLKLRPLSCMSNHSFTFNGCMLICGPKGVGKSAFANALCKKLVKHPYFVFVRIIHCLPLKGKRVETIAKKWDDAVSEAIHCQPSLLLFEDLDYIASCPASHEQEVGPDGIYFASIVQAFIHMLKRITGCESKVAVIVTSQSTHSLHHNLVNTKGRHIFQSIIEVQPPNVEQRAEILYSLVCSKPHISRNTMKHIPWTELASKTEGFVAQDLDSLVDRATHAAWVRLASSSKYPEILLIKEDFEMALEGYVPSSLRGIPLQMQDQKSWTDVGGLKDVKKVIQQIIMWPVKYKQIFKNYSLKPQTNILLYGAPGTGKTLLAGVIANECGLNFISIKGPELLSKYIGASEQAIRDLFKRASTARPCILFFDEFDSIAPRRGHDSTGVTDRVVNQLLTQLDGVESLEGVHVLAATSRPELIDPALLRPGRLDKCLLCPLPNEEERLEILKCLSAKLPLCEDINFKQIASQTEYFSGADLQALLYSAHIEALHDVQNSTSRRYSISSDDMNYSDAGDKLLYMPTIQDGLTIPAPDDGKKIIQEVTVIKEKYFGIQEQTTSRRSTLSVFISQRHLLKVADSMKPSVSPEERLRYEIVFQNFRNTLSGEPTTSLSENVKRVTLA